MGKCSVHVSQYEARSFIEVGRPDSLLQCYERVYINLTYTYALPFVLSPYRPIRFHWRLSTFPLAVSCEHL